MPEAALTAPETFEKEVAAIPPSIVPLKHARGLLGALMLAGVLADPAPLTAQSTAPQNKDKDAQMAEDLQLQMLKGRILELTPDLDSESPALRNKASHALNTMTQEWVKSKRKPFPLMHLLQTDKKFSLEKNARLSHVGTRHESTLLVQPLDATYLSFAEKGEKLTEEQLRDRIFTDTGENITLPEDSGDIKLRVQGKQPLWDAVNALRLAQGKGHNIFRSFNGDLAIRSTTGFRQLECCGPSETWTSTQGPLLMQISRFYSGLDDNGDGVPVERMNMRILAEKQYLLRATNFNAAHGKTDTGEPFLIGHVSGQHFPIIHDANYLHVPMLPKAKNLQCEITFEVIANESETVSVPDANKEHTIDIEKDFAFTHSGKAEHQKKDEKEWWRVSGSSVSGFEKRELLNIMRCIALDKSGKPLVATSRGIAISPGGYTVYWDFPEPPEQVSYTVPKAEIRRIVTFPFPNISVRAE